MTTRKQAFFFGTKAISPILLGVIPFAMIAGISAIAVGFSKIEALGISFIVFAGASQLAALALIQQHAPVAIVILTALIVNFRFFMYSASLAPHFNGLSFRRRGLLAYLLTDQAYAVSITAFDRDCRLRKHWFYLGAAVTIWATWQAGNLAGIFLGMHIPKDWSLDFAIPLTFLALLFPAIRNAPTLAAAVSAGALALVAHGLPYNLGLILAAIGGIVAGCVADGRKKHAS